VDCNLGLEKSFRGVGAARFYLRHTHRWFVFSGDKAFVLLGMIRIVEWEICDGGSWFRRLKLAGSNIF